MLGFHSDGIRLFGASDTLTAQLKKRNIPFAKEITGNTLVFAIDDEAIVQKRPYHISFAAASTPWFVCSLRQDTQIGLRFASETALATFITAVYYASQEFLHLDIELSFLKETLSAPGVIEAYSEDAFAQIPADTPVICFYFGNGGFLETDRIFSTFTKQYDLDISHITLAGSFASKRDLLCAFVLRR